MNNITCKCGAIEIALKPNAKGTRVNCYCDSCRGFVQACEASDRYLNEEGGVEIFQTTPDQLTIIKGQDRVSATQIKPNGLYRFHCLDCQTPLTNAMRKSGVPMMGLVIPNAQHFPKEPELGIVKAAYMTKAKPVAGNHGKDFGLMTMIFGVASRGILAKISGRSTKSDWHNAAGNWRVVANVLSKDQSTELYKRSKSL